jgi:threonine dehydratase
MDAPASKRAATEGYGAQVIEYDRYADDRDALTRAHARETGMTLVHAYDEPRVMAGAGTVGLELVSDSPDLSTIAIPLGGGGLLSGCLIAIKAVAPRVRVVGVEPEASPDYRRSLAARERVSVDIAPSIMDGQLLPEPGERPWEVISALVDDVVLVSDDEVRAAMRLLFERAKLVAEPSGASALAAVLAGRITGERIGVVLSGANVSTERFAELLS